MTGNDLVEYVTKELVKYAEMPKEKKRTIQARETCEKKGIRVFFIK